MLFVNFRLQKFIWPILELNIHIPLLSVKMVENGRKNVHLILFINFLFLILNFADGVPYLRSRHKKGTAITLIKYPDEDLGRSVLAAGDRMVSSTHPALFLVKKHLKQMYKHGQISQARGQQLDDLLVGHWELIPSNVAHRKVQYIPLVGGGKEEQPPPHAAIGFTGTRDTLFNFRDLMGEGAEPKSMQDLAQILDKAHRDSEFKWKEPTERQRYLATDGVDIYKLHVGGQTRPRAEKMEGNVHASGFGSEEIKKRLGPIFDGGYGQQRTFNKDEVIKYVQDTYADILSF